MRLTCHDKTGDIQEFREAHEHSSMSMKGGII